MEGLLLAWKGDCSVYLKRYIALVIGVNVRTEVTHWTGIQSLAMALEAAGRWQRCEMTFFWHAVKSTRT